MEKTNFKPLILAWQLKTGNLEKIQCFDISSENHKRCIIDVSCKSTKFDGMVINFEDGIFEVIETGNENYINVFKETRSLVIALRYLFNGNKQKVNHVIDMSSI